MKEPRPATCTDGEGRGGGVRRRREDGQEGRKKREEVAVKE